MILARQSCHFLKKILYVVLLTLLLYKNYFKTNSNFCQQFLELILNIFCRILERLIYQCFRRSIKLKNFAKSKEFRLTN